MRTVRTRLERRLATLPGLDEVLLGDDAEAMASPPARRRRRAQASLPMRMTRRQPLQPDGSGPPCDDCGASVSRGNCQLCQGSGRLGISECGACEGTGICRTCRGSGINPPTHY